jgi:hypothetical protein
MMPNIIAILARVSRAKRLNIRRALSSTEADEPALSKILDAREFRPR